MSNKQRGLIIISIFAVAAILLSACQMSASTPPPATKKAAAVTANPAFATPIGTDAMKMVEELAHQTQTAAAGGGAPGTPQPIVLTPQAGTTPQIGTPTNAAAAGTTPIQVPAGANATPVPVGVRPTSYTLQAGEFPYCIARRFDVDPSQLLCDGLSCTNYEVPGTVLKIPQSGSFPDGRALASHPATYTVLSADETLYSIACKYGDVDPNAIAAANGISTSAKLSPGQQIKIP